MASPRSRSTMGGFTLLEIMVALAVFATLAAAVLSASQYVVKQRGAVEARLFAAWLADNRLNELRLQPGLAVGQQQQVVSMEQRDWVLQQYISATSDPRLLQVDIQVSPANTTHTLNRASGWILAVHE
ncbi:type II secretion system minor pseudopilin GspI [Pseudomonas laurylsulfatiphila]|uniref:type II secretion system minor pseudopilin GspI n=1 Tax=Pseudomonas laurylsulfatiphila TaxID=2011015 RepID=UPI002160B827|nr:type II secretion system minor pseudopilin GspI [Pseudomonas laurylsulfatiphila]UVM05485.1 type II secretion system minor pseudopilin GspI [Pseudomonas laurylsulfatiphila]